MAAICLPWLGQSDDSFCISIPVEFYVLNIVWYAKSKFSEDDSFIGKTKGKKLNLFYFYF